MNCREISEWGKYFRGILLLLVIYSCSGNQKTYKKEYSTILYSSKNHGAVYVNYQIRKGKLNSAIARTNDFRVDSLVDTLVQLKDYKKSGYDRGHLKPAGSSKTNVSEMSESFLLSNIVPQYPSMNRGVWKRIEEYERSLLLHYDSLNIYTGTICRKLFNKKLPDSRIRIPKYFFKTIQTPDSLTIAFLCFNGNTDDAVMYEVMSVNQIEKLIKQDLYPGLPERFEFNSKNDFKIKF